MSFELQEGDFVYIKDEKPKLYVKDLSEADNGNKNVSLYYAKSGTHRVTFQVDIGLRSHSGKFDIESVIRNGKRYNRFNSWQPEPVNRYPKLELNDGVICENGRFYRVKCINGVKHTIYNDAEDRVVKIGKDLWPSMGESQYKPVAVISPDGTAWKWQKGVDRWTFLDKDEWSMCIKQNENWERIFNRKKGHLLHELAAQEDFTLGQFAAYRDGERIGWMEKVDGNIELHPIIRSELFDQIEAGCVITLKSGDTFKVKDINDYTNIKSICIGDRSIAYTQDCHEVGGVSNPRFNPNSEIVKVEKPMYEVTVFNNTTAENNLLTLPAGLTVMDAIETAGYSTESSIVRVNSLEVSPDTEVRDGDKISITSAKTKFSGGPPMPEHLVDVRGPSHPTRSSSIAYKESVQTRAGAQGPTGIQGPTGHNELVKYANRVEKEKGPLYETDYKFTFSKEKPKMKTFVNLVLLPFQIALGMVLAIGAVAATYWFGQDAIRWAMSLDVKAAATSLHNFATSPMTIAAGSAISGWLGGCFTPTLARKTLGRIANGIVKTNKAIVKMADESN